MEKSGWMLGVCMVTAGALACGGSTHGPDAGTPLQGPDASVNEPDAGVVYLPDDPWCDRVASETGPAVTVTLGLSKVHARVRYFGALDSVTQADDALVAALERTHGEVEERTAAEFAVEIPSLCRVAPVPHVARAAQVELMADVAVVHPGTGAVVIPQAASAVVLDFRDVVEGAGVEVALKAAVVAAFHGTLPGLTEHQVRRVGLTDEAFAMGIYAVDTVDVEQPILAGEATVQRPMAVLLGEKLAPSAARWAARLRVTGHAWLVGQDLLSEVAESDVETVGAAVMAWRNRELRWNGQRIADVIAADEPSILQLGAVLLRNGPPPVVGNALRPPIQANLDFNAVQGGDADVGHTRAALLCAHGAANLFFPYFETVGNQTDARLTETLERAASVTDRFGMRDALRRFGNVLHDGHNWTVDNVLDARPARMLNVLFDDENDFPVVARSYSTDLHVGDTVLMVDDMAAPQWLLGETELCYGATDGFRRFNALSELTLKKLPSSLRVRNSEGLERTQDIHPATARGDLFAGSTRNHGFLTDLGHADIYYMNLDGAYVGSDSVVTTALVQAGSARGLILDMRGHPASRGAMWDPYAFLQRLMAMSFSTPRYRVPVLVAGEHTDDIHPYESAFAPLDDVTFHGPVVFIVDRMAVSFAEDFAMMLMGANRASAVVGRPSAGTTGSVTGTQLPGGFSFYMTGMEARWPNGETFFGRGALPTVPVTPTAADYASGLDPFLRAAISAVP